MKSLYFKSKIALGSLKDYLQNIHRRQIEKQFIKRFVVVDSIVSGSYDTKTSLVLEQFKYRNENWNYVLRLKKVLLYRTFGLKLRLQDNDCDDKRVKKLPDGCYQLKAYGTQPRWLYFIYDECPGNRYRIDIHAEFLSLFHEVQIAFNHIDIADRMRFRIVDNQSLVFEVISRGYFFHNIAQQHCEGIKKMDFCTFSLAVDRERYTFLLNNKPLMTIEDKQFNVATGGLALIFYDYTDMPISMNIHDITLSRDNADASQSQQQL